MTEMELAISRIEPDAAIEYVCETILRLEALMKRARELEKDFKANLLRYVKANGDVTIGAVRWYAGHAKKTECNSNKAVMETLLELAGPDRASDCISSTGWKHGAVKKLLDEMGSPELYDRLFTERYDDKLEEGKPKEKQLQKFDAGYVR